MNRLFGTDGIRGVANADLTPELAFSVGRAGAAVLAATSDPERPVVVGRDTRLSGTMLEAAVVAGITSAGRDTLSLGIVPTPAVASITTHIEAAAGVMISASHNPIEDNGIKFFGSDGFKLSDAVEDAIAEHVDRGDVARPTHYDVGLAKTAHGLLDRYFATLVDAGRDLSALTVVVDAAFGAAHAVAPKVLRHLGADVVEINCSPDGSRINVACGATDLRMLSETVKRVTRESGRPAVGVAFDGDADRALFIDECGATVTGDHVMMIVGREQKRAGKLARDTIVGTVMSNVGLERALREDGITLARAAVGDRYVLERMVAEGFTFGGEQSGHIIDLTRNTTGDGPLTAVVLFSILARTGARLADLASGLRIYPQILINVRTPNKAVLDSSAPIREAIERAERELAGVGRVLVRPSGTEPLIRVMMEGEDQAQIDRLAREVAGTIEACAG